MLEFMRLARTALATRVRGLVASVVGFGGEGADDDAENVDGCEVVHPAGYLARPAVTAKSQALVYRDGDECVVLAIVDKSLATVSDLAEGEVRITGVVAANLVAALRILASGEFTITSKSGQSIKLNGAEATATMPVAYETSGTAGHFHLANGSSGGGRAPGTLTAGPWAVTGVTSTDVDSIAVGQGSQHVLVPDTQ